MPYVRLHEPRRWKVASVVVILFSIFALSAVLSAPAVAQAKLETQAKPDAKALVQSGRLQLVDARKAATEDALQKAEATFTQALQLEPDNIAALAWRGLARLERSGLVAKQGNFEASGALTNEAIADLDRAVKLGPNDYAARLMRGMSYAQFPPLLNKGATAIDDLETVTKHALFAAQTADVRAKIHLTLGRAHAVAGQAEKAKEDFRAAVEASPKSADGTAAQQELDKLAAAPLATDSQGNRRPDHFPQISADMSPIIVAATVTLPTNKNAQGKDSLAPSMQKFLVQLDKQPGLLGKHTLTSMDHPQMLVILTWWKDKKALNDWFYSDTHQGIIKEYYPDRPGHPASTAGGKTMNQAGQVGMELFTSLPGSVR